jgi:hypothetical protein
VQEFKKGFSIIWRRGICVHDGGCWKVGNKRLSIQEFGEALKTTSLNAFLKDFNLEPISRHYLLRDGTIHDNTNAKKAHKLVAWRFDSDAYSDELPRILILTEWVIRLGGGQKRTLSWEPESALHTICKPLLLAFWTRCGGRDSSLDILVAGRPTNILFTKCLGHGCSNADNSILAMGTQNRRGRTRTMYQRL